MSDNSSIISNISNKSKIIGKKKKGNKEKKEMYAIKKVIQNTKNIIEPWEHIFNSLNYNYNENLLISSTQLKNARKTWEGVDNQFEPRLLAYQPSLSSRPEIFKKKDLYILPVKNGEYTIIKDNIYMELDYIYDEKEIIQIKKHTESLILNIGCSESSNIDNLRYSGVFERPEILNESILYGSLLNGRHRCSFDFELNNIIYRVKGVQYETDACYESKNKILIIEAKSTDKVIDSFNIRQLYYPFRTIYDNTKGKKEIVCLFIHILNDICYIWKYTFKNPIKMDSIKLVGHYAYSLKD